MSKLLSLAFAAVLFAAPAFAQGSTANPTALDIGAIPTGSPQVQGVYSATPPQSSSSRDVALSITPYSHVSLNSTATTSTTISPGGDGTNMTRINNGNMTYATNRAVSAGNVVSVNVTGANGAADFDELNFYVYGGGIRTVLDIAAAGDAGTFASPVFTFASNGTAKTLISGFGQVVATRPLIYDIAVSDVALQGSRTFTTTLTVSPF